MDQRILDRRRPLLSAFISTLFFCSAFFIMESKSKLVLFNTDYWGTRTVFGNRLGIHFYVKVLECFRITRSGDAYDEMDDRYKMGQDIIRISVFLSLRRRSRIHTGRSSWTSDQRRYNWAWWRCSTVCTGVIDCMKLSWKIFPLAEKGHYNTRKEIKVAIIVAEGWCDQKCTFGAGLLDS